MLLLSFAALPALGQRQRVLGRIKSLDRKAWAGAEVVLVSPSRLPPVEEADRLVVPTDERGRFRAQLLEGRAYSVWARRKDATRTRWTEVAHDVVAGRVVTLVESPDRQIPVRVRFVGLDRWQGKGVLSFWVVDPGGDRIGLSPDAEGHASLPGLPGSRCTLECDLDRGLLFTRLISLTRSGREAVRQRLAREKKALAGAPIGGLPDVGKEKLPPLDMARIVVPPPLEIPLQVVSQRTGVAVGGARVSYEAVAGPWWRKPRAVTGPDGRASFHVAREVDSWGRARSSRQFYFHVVAKGYALREGGWSSWNRSGMKPLEENKIENGRAPELRLELRDGLVARGKITNAEGLRLQILRRLFGTEPVKGGGSYSTQRHDLLQVAPDGTFELIGLARDTQWPRLALLLPGRAVASEVPTGRWLDCPMPKAPLGRGDVETTIDLARLRYLQVRVQLPDGTPAAGARVRFADERQWIEQYSGRYSPFSGCLVAADRRGRCRLPNLDRARELLILHDEHYGLVRVPKAGPGVLELELKPLATVTGRVVDATGSRAPGATVQVVERTWSGSSPLTILISSINDHMLEARTDARGRFRLRFIPDRSVSCGIGARYAGGGSSILESTKLSLGDSSVADAELTLQGTIARRNAPRPDKRRP